MEQYVPITIVLSLVCLGGYSIWFIRPTQTPNKQLSISGLMNEGNTCFMNSVVQCLASFDVLEEFLENTGVLRELLDLITLLKVRKGPRTLRTRELVMELGKEKKDLFTYQQQDAQEFYQLLSFTITKQSTRVHLNGIGVNSVLGLEDSIPILFSGRKIHVEKRGKRSPLTGLLASRISCLQCRHQVIQLNKSPWRHDTFDNLSIPIPDQNGCTLESLLKSYTKPEFIDGYVCEKCTFLATKMKKMKKSDREWIETCLLNNTFDLKKPDGLEMVKVQAKTAKQTSIAYAPKCLCLHMQRSMYLPSGHLIKNNAPIEFPDVLDLNELVLGKPVLPVLKPTTMKSDPEVGFMMEDEMSNYMGPLKPVEKERIMESLPEALELVENVFTKRPFRYRLASMILHYGHHDSGHFVALRRVKYKTPNGIREAWFRISDATVERIVDVENDVFYHGSRFCYMLFYQRE